ncbi:MAG: hypothetical protein NTV88_04250 [Candidatus Micrarchaeota archaeon]|nr:hypothetical protein [Candidatus Micrarchaeota archaeon]
MGNCTRCGKEMDGEGMCSNCASLSTHGTGTPEDVPCQRCGMYLPSHELQMWNSRLYCAYCIMDVKDDDARSKGERKPEERAAHEEGGGGLFSGLFGGKGEEKESSDKSGEIRYQQYAHTAAGTCERCGRESDVLYMVQGRKLCPQCVQVGGEVGASPSFMGQIVSVIKRTVGIKPQPKIIANQPIGKVFDIRSRKMTDRKETAQTEKEAALSEDRAYDEPPAAPKEVFDVRDRKFEDKKEGMEAEQPMSESAREEKKSPPKKIKKLFFNLHPSGAGGVKKKK